MADDSNFTEQQAQQAQESAKQQLNRLSQPVKNVAKKKIKQGTRQITKKAKSAIRKGGKAVAKAAKKAIVTAAKALAQAIVKLVMFIVANIVPIAIGVIIFCSITFVWHLEERGSSGQLDQDYQYENPTVLENGVNVAVALTEPQALIDAYYKYLACDSHTKLFVDPDTGDEVWLQFSNSDETSDFAGLIDTYNKENYFYLSSYFIKMADELLHNKEFYYPEQVIKPVFSKVLPLETPDPDNPNMKYITTLPLVNDGSPMAEAMANGDPIYATNELSASGSTDEAPKRSHNSSASLDLLATSKTYETGDYTYTDETGATQTATGLVNQGDTEEPGVWDYGFGSVLQYAAAQKDKYIQCKYDSFDIHVHTLITTSVWDDDADDYVDVTTESCTGTVINITVNDGDTVSTLKDKIDAYNTDSMKVVVAPTDAVLGVITNTEANKHIAMSIQPEDAALSATEFDNSTLQKYFGNNDATTYPISVPVIVAAATFSGSLRYDYEQQTYSSELKQDEGTFFTDNNNDCSTLVYSSPTSTSDCTYDGAKVYRSGSVMTTQPSSTPTEYATPLGFQYLEDYDNHYKIYVPDLVRRDTDFQERVKQKQPGSYDSALDADKDGELTLMDFLLKLGLLKPYAGGSLTAMTDVPSGTDPTADELELLNQAGVGGIADKDEQNIMLLAKCIASEAGPNKLDQLMVAAVVMNRLYDSRFPNSIIGILTAPGQYASWTNGSIQSKTPTEQMLSSAKQVYYGEFAIPWNVIAQKLGAFGEVYMVVINPPGFYDTTYSISIYDDAIAQTDRFGRPALTEQQARDLADTLNQADIAAGISAGGSTGGTTGGGTTPSTGGATAVGDVVSEYTLYAADGFDVVTAISNMRQLSDKSQGVGFLQRLINAASEFLSSIQQQILGFFTYIGDAFGSNTGHNYYMMYNYNVPLTMMRDTVFQAITFSDQATYSDTADSIDEDALVFLFVGKNGAIGSGTNGAANRLVLGTGSTFEGFTSPTTRYFQATSPWNETTGSVTLATPAGTIVQAVGDGTVVEVTGEETGPYTVSMTATADGKTLRMTYGNLSEVSVSSGQTVSKGDTIGKTAEGGLIFSLLVDGTNVNPMQYFYQPVFGSNAAFMDILNSNGYVDEALKNQLEAEINAANNSATGVVDKWHQAPANYHSAGECTWWAYGRGKQFCEQNGTLPAGGMASGYGNGGDFYDRAQQAGHFAVGSTPRAGSWIVWSRVIDPSGHYYGHVAFVEAVEANGDIWISESWHAKWYAKDGHGVVVRKISGPDYVYSANYRFKGFVYLDSPLS